MVRAGALAAGAPQRGAASPADAPAGGVLRLCADHAGAPAPHRGEVRLPLSLPPRGARRRARTLRLGGRRRDAQLHDRGPGLRSQPSVLRRADGGRGAGRPGARRGRRLRRRGGRVAEGGAGQQRRLRGGGATGRDAAADVADRGSVHRDPGVCRGQQRAVRQSGVLPLDGDALPSGVVYGGGHCGHRRREPAPLRAALPPPAHGERADGEHVAPAPVPVPSPAGGRGSDASRAGALPRAARAREVRDAAGLSAGPSLCRDGGGALPRRGARPHGALAARRRGDSAFLIRFYCDDGGGARLPLAEETQALGHAGRI